jgi:trehalose 6-phosphate phosphatase
MKFTGAKLLLATDFDGTAAAISADGADVMWAPAALALLSELSHRSDTELAIISGRPMTDVADYAASVRCFRAASFGAEVHDPNGVIIRTHPAFNFQLPVATVSEVAAAGMWLEEKPHGLALHWQSASAAGAQLRVVDAFSDWAKSRSLRLQSGRCFIEANNHGFDKASALHLIAEITRPRAVIFCGNDDSDARALEWAAARGKAFFVRNNGSAPPTGCVSVESIETLWAHIREAVAELLI